MVFEKSDDAITHAGIILYLACHDFAGLSCPDDEDGDLEGTRFLHDFCQNDAEETEKGERQCCIENDVESGYVPRDLRKEHEDDSKDGAADGSMEELFHHLINQHAPGIQAFIQDENHVDQRHPEELVNGCDMIDVACNQKVPDGKGQGSCQDKGYVVADEVEKCGAGGAGNRMVVILMVHVVVYPSCFLDARYQMSDFRFQTSDFRLQMSDVRCRMSDIGYRSRMSDVSQSLSLKKG